MSLRSAIDQVWSSLPSREDVGRHVRCAVDYVMGNGEDREAIHKKFREQVHAHANKSGVAIQLAKIGRRSAEKQTEEIDRINHELSLGEMAEEVIRVIGRR